jgi:hypothetical protein
MEAIIAAAAHQCAGCGTDFPSKNKLFKHLRETGCAGGERVITRVERHVLLFGTATGTLPGWMPG